MNLINVLNIAVDIKPKFGQPCNHCGYCCLTEVCLVGQELTGATIGPCKLLITDGDKHTCKLATNESVREALGIGVGCCAETQAEAIQRIRGEE